MHSKYPETMRTVGHPLVTLSEVLRLALPPGTEVLAGAGELDRPITWARLLRARPVSLGAIEPGELVLVSTAAGSLGTDGRVLARLIRDLSDAGVSAFVVGESCPDEAVAAAIESHTPLLSLPAGASVVDTERSIVGLIVDRDGQVRRRVEQVYERMVASLMDDAGTPALASIVAAATGKQVAVLDEYLHVQATAPDDALPEGFAQACLEQIDSSGRGGTRRPVIRPIAGADAGGALLMVPLVLKGTPAGYLAVVGPSEQFGDLDQQVTERAASVLAMETAKQRAVTEVRLRVQGDLVEDLLAGTFPSEEAVQVRARSLGYDLGVPHVICCLAPDLDGDGAAAPSRGRTQRFLEHARHELLRLYPSALVREGDGVISIAVPFRRLGETSEVVERIDELRQALSQALDGAPLSVGIGRSHGSPVGFPRAHREAQQALVSAQVVFGGDQVVHFETLGAHRLLLELRNAPPLQEFVQDMLGPLEQHDMRHRSELVETVATFLACNGNHVRTAQELHLHRNSLLYRLERVQAVLHRELDDPEVRLALQLALRARRLLQHDQSRRLPNG